MKVLCDEVRVRDHVGGAPFVTNVRLEAGREGIERRARELGAGDDELVQVGAVSVGVRRGGKDMWIAELLYHRLQLVAPLSEEGGRVPQHSAVDGEAAEDGRLYLSR